MRRVVALAAAFLAAAATLAAPGRASQPAAQPPRLVVVIVVDQLSSDLFDQYRDQFSGGLARLAGGIAFANGYQGHAASETCPGHSTILTGVHPGRAGIIANNWIDQSLPRADKTVYCAEDPQAAGSSSRSYRVSAFYLKVPTLGERMKQVFAASRSVAVAGKDQAAVMLGGRSPDQRWYWDGKAFASYLAGTAVPRAVSATNIVAAARIATAQPPLDPPPLCAARSRRVAVGSAGRTIGDGRFERAAGAASAFRASPEFDGTVLALAAALRQEMRLGEGPATDLLAIGLSATDYVGHAYGTAGQEMCLQLLSLDRDLGSFFALLDASGIDYAVALTADHGGQDIPERLREQGAASAARVDPALNATSIGKAIGARLGLAGPLLHSNEPFGDVYLDRRLGPADRARVAAAAIAAYRAHPQVAAVLTSAELAAAPLPVSPPDRWTLFERARASFDAARSGDLVVLAKALVTPIVELSGPTIATHGSPWDYDRRVPILFWRRGIAPADRSEAVASVDIMPTLGALAGLAVNPGEIDGHCLAAVAAGRCPPR